MLDTISKFLPGAKTYIGLIITFLGTLATTLGWDWFGAIAADLQEIGNLVVTLVGLVIATIGRLTAKPKDPAAPAS